ncbi:MAG: alpha-E domain-containing protein [Maioricimonas sp. JB045]|uniref:alpha-E domain-containing protein n=1 Tax=Maioricimonas sp. JC845 TaxID=3232138 RepID=UPI0034591EBB
MLSRVAESIYWMARYVERAENLCRYVDVTLNLILDQPIGAGQQWEPLVSTTGDQEYFNEHYETTDADSVIQFLTFDRDYPNSIISSLRIARENARSVRETISSESWEALNEFYHFVLAATNNGGRVESPSEFFRTVRQYSQLFGGVVDATMAHGESWNFYNMGRMLERADKTTRILDVKYFTLLPSIADVGTPIDDLQWSAVLQSVSGLETYRKRYHGLTVPRIIEFLILDRAFPRAVSYCLTAADNSLHGITGAPTGEFCNSAEQRLGLLRSELAFMRVEEIVDNGLHQFIDSLQRKMNSASKCIHETFFALRPVESLTMSQNQSQG